MGDIIRYVEDTTMNGVAFSVTTVHTMSYRPDLLIDGEAVALLTEGDDAPGQDSWYWTPDGNTVYRGDSVPPDAGVVVTVDYEAESSNSVAVEVPTMISVFSENNRSGDYVRVIDVRGLTSVDQAQAIASGVLRRASTIPETLKFQTYENGWQPGQVFPANVTAYGISGTYLVTSVTSNSQGFEIKNPRGDGVEFRSSFTRQIEALKIQGAPEQDPPATDDTIPSTSYDSWPTAQFERAVTQSSIVIPQAQYETAPFVFGVGGTLTGGVQTSNNHLVAFSGNAMVAFAQMETPSTGQDVKLDILKNGLTIMSTKITLPAGSRAVVTSTSFIGHPRAFRIKQGDKLRGVLTYSTTSTTTTGASGVSMYLLIAR